MKYVSPRLLSYGGNRASTTAMKKQRVVRNRIPADILENAGLNEAIGRLPPNYNFEVHKTVWRIREVSPGTASHVLPVHFT
ncbi:unnamed protein product [Hapterophycus canaliculatus]